MRLVCVYARKCVRACVHRRLKLHGLATGHVIGVLVLPALVSIFYGGFAPSGGVVLWSFVGPFSSLYFNQPGSM